MIQISSTPIDKQLGECLLILRRCLENFNDLSWNLSTEVLNPLSKSIDLIRSITLHEDDNNIKNEISQLMNFLKNEFKFHHFVEETLKNFQNEENYPLKFVEILQIDDSKKNILKNVIINFEHSIMIDSTFIDHVSIIFPDKVIPSSFLASLKKLQNLITSKLICLQLWEQYSLVYNEDIHRENSKSIEDVYSILNIEIQQLRDMNTKLKNEIERLNSIIEDEKIQMEEMNDLRTEKIKFAEWNGILRKKNERLKELVKANPDEKNQALIEELKQKEVALKELTGIIANMKLSFCKLVQPES